MPTFAEILERFEKLGLPIAENEFKETAKNPLPEPPFIIYIRTTKARGDDRSNKITETTASFGIYTENTYKQTARAALESKIETEILPDVEYSKNNAAVDTENIVLTTYDFNIIEKKGD
jgi:hypothetical protein